MLKQTEEQGYTKSVSNKGRILTPKGAEEVIALTFSEDPKHSKDIMELRKLIEPYAVRLATVRATEEDLQEIKELDFEHRYVIRKGESGSEQDLRIHLKFAF